MRLAQDQIKNAEFLVYDNVESCGFIRGDELYVDSVGEYNTCNYSHYERYIFHTHPASSKSYPSEYDIIKILKLRENPEVSVIFTKWGVWEFTSSRKQRINDNFAEKLRVDIKAIYDSLYPVSKEDLTFRIEEMILNCNYKLMDFLDAFEFEIHFIPWNEFSERGFRII